jgi:D-glycero-D-manno-heptose 1,7-bisphosphate phosphatase
MIPRQVVVLVGGKGTRLGDLASATPKPMLEIAPGLRFLDVVLEHFARHGLTDIVLLAGHMGDQVEAAYQGARILDAGVRVLREPEPMGTAGALRHAAGVLDSWFVMSNGDSLFEFNVRALTRDLSEAGAGRIALRDVPDPGRYGAVVSHGEVVAEFLEKNPALKGPMAVNGGVYCLSREVLDLIHGPSSIEADIFPKLVARRRLTARKFDGYFLDMGLPDTYAQACAEIPGRRHRPAVYFDRDGVLNIDAGHTHRTSDLVLTPGAVDAVRQVNEAGALAIVVTNQAGIGKGIHTEAQMRDFHAAMQDRLMEAGAHIDAFYHCPFHDEAVLDRFRVKNHPDRKPNPGMILRAAADFGVDLSRSALIGDQPTDMAAAAAAGVKGVMYAGGDLAATVTDVLAAMMQPSGR